MGVREFDHTKANLQTYFNTRSSRVKAKSGKLNHHSTWYISRTHLHLSFRLQNITSIGYSETI